MHIFFLAPHHDIQKLKTFLAIQIHKFFLQNTRFHNPSMCPSLVDSFRNQKYDPAAFIRRCVTIKTEQVLLFYLIFKADKFTVTDSRSKVIANTIFADVIRGLPLPQPLAADVTVTTVCPKQRWRSVKQLFYCAEAKGQAVLADVFLR